MFRAFWGDSWYNPQFKVTSAIKAGHGNLGFFHSARAEVEGLMHLAAH